MDDVKRTVRAMIAMGLAAVLSAMPGTGHASAPAAAEAATSEDAAAKPSMIEVHVGETITRAGALSEKIHEDVVRVLRAHRIDLDAQERTRLTLGVGGESYAYRINVAVFRDGTIVAPAPAPWTCECTNEELLVEISQHVVDLLPVLRGDEPAASTAATATAPPSRTTDTAEPTSPGRLRPGGKAGIGLLVGGVALAATGGGLVGAGVSESRDDDALEGDGKARDLRPAGYALLGVGAATAIVGAILLGLDRRRARRHQVTMTPSIGPRMTGFSLTARF